MEENIKMILQRIVGGDNSQEVEENLIILETERNKFLKEQEDLWRIRIWAIWVKSGD
jgi:hypothetical protein